MFGISKLSRRTRGLGRDIKKAFDDFNRSVNAIPENCKFPPSSDKFSEGVPVPGKWVDRYISYRESLPQSSDSQPSLQAYLQSVGQNSSLLADKFRGAMLGLALGDALGTTLEFKARDTYQHITDIVGGGPFSLEPGQWTDDTSMALCLAFSLLNCGGFNAYDQMSNYRLWRDEGAFSVNDKCFDIGITVSGAIQSYVDSGNPFCGSTDPQTAGNGALMRLVSIPLFYFSSIKKVIKWAGESSRTTHGAQESISACQYYSALIWGAVSGVSKRELLDGIYEPLTGLWSDYPLSQAVERVAFGAASKSRDQIKSTGYVIDTIEAAIWAFANTSSFKDGALLAANLGDDADTVCAVYGQLAGAFYGEQGIPVSWVRKLWYNHVFYLKADELLKYGVYDLSPLTGQ